MILALQYFSSTYTSRNLDFLLHWFKSLSLRLCLNPTTWLGYSGVGLNWILNIIFVNNIFLLFQYLHLALVYFSYICYHLVAYISTINCYYTYSYLYWLFFSFDYLDQSKESNCFSSLCIILHLIFMTYCILQVSNLIPIRNYWTSTYASILYWCIWFY